jgi:hypothetical protein
LLTNHLSGTRPTSQHPGCTEAFILANFSGWLVRSPPSPAVCEICSAQHGVGGAQISRSAFAKTINVGFEFSDLKTPLFSEFFIDHACTKTDVAFFDCIDSCA